MAELYTPFATRAMQDFLERDHKRKVRKASQGAYMGDPAAMADLYNLDADAAMGIEQHQTQQAEIAADRASKNAKEEREKRDHRMEFYEKHRDWMDELTIDVGSFQDYEQAKQYADRVIAEFEQMTGEDVPIDELTPELFAQMQEMSKNKIGKDWQPVGNSVTLDQGDGQLRSAINMMNKRTGQIQQVITGEGQVVTPNDPRRRGDIAATVASEEGKVDRDVGRIEDGLASLSAIGDLERAQELLETVETYGLAKATDALRIYFNDQSLTVTDRAELNSLLATDFLQKLEYFTGPKSDKDVQLVQEISSGANTTTPVNKRLVDRLVRKLRRKIDLGSRAADGEFGSDFDREEFNAYFQARDVGKTKDNPIIVTSKEELAAVPSGSWVQDPASGRVARKK